MKLIPLADYIVKEFNEKAEQLDKFKVAILTIFNTAIATIFTVQGMVSFFNIKSAFWSSIMVVLFAISYFRLYRVWFVGHTMMGDIDTDKKENT